MFFGEFFGNCGVCNCSGVSVIAKEVVSSRSNSKIQRRNRLNQWLVFLLYREAELDGVPLQAGGFVHVLYSGGTVKTGYSALVKGRTNCVEPVGRVRQLSVRGILLVGDHSLWKECSS